MFYRNIPHKCCIENQNTQLICNNIFLKSFHLWDKVEKYATARQATDHNTAHAHCMLCNLGYRHTLRICNTYSFSAAKMLTLTRLNVRLNLHCLPQNTPMTDDLLTAQCSQCTFWNVISPLAITAIRYSIVRDSDHFLLLYSWWSKNSLFWTERKEGF